MTTPDTREKGKKSPRIEPCAIPIKQKNPSNRDGHGSKCVSLLAAECGENGSSAATPRSLSASKYDGARPRQTQTKDGGCDAAIQVARTSSKSRKSPAGNLSLASRQTPLNRSRERSLQTATEKSTLNLFEALELDPEGDHETGASIDRAGYSKSPDNHSGPSSSVAGNMGVPLPVRMQWSEDVEELIRETDKAFKAVGFTLSDARSTNEGFHNYRPPTLEKERSSGSSNESGTILRESPSATNMRFRAKKAKTPPLTRDASVKAVQPQRKKGIKAKNQRLALHAFPSPPNSSPRWTLPEVTAELFGGRIFGRLEADEMLTTPDRLKHPRCARESIDSQTSQKPQLSQSSISRSARVSLRRVSQEGTSSGPVRTESTDDNAIPVGPFHLDELATRLGKVQVEDSNEFGFSAPRLSPPLVQIQDNKMHTQIWSDLEPVPMILNTVLPPLPTYSPISPPTPSGIYFNLPHPTSPAVVTPVPAVSLPTPGSVTALLSPVSGVSAMSDEGFVPNLLFGKLKFPAPPLGSPPKASRSRSVTRTSLATIREASPASNTDAVPSHQSSPRKQRSPIRTPHSSGAVSASFPRPSPHSRRLQHRAHSSPGSNILTESRSEVATPSSHSNQQQQKSGCIRITADNLISTPYSLTSPLFKHGSIRLNKSLRQSQSADSSGYVTPFFHHDEGLDVAAMPLDWTAFQMALSPGCGEYPVGGAGPDEKTHQEGEEREVEEILDWWLGMGFKGRDRGMGKVMKKESGPKNKKRRVPGDRPDTLIEMLPAELHCVKPRGYRPFSFMLGQEEVVWTCGSGESSRTVSLQMIHEKGDGGFESGECSQMDSMQRYERDEDEWSCESRHSGRWESVQIHEKGDERSCGSGESSQRESIEIHEKMDDEREEVQVDCQDCGETQAKRRSVDVRCNLEQDLSGFLRWESLNVRPMVMERVRSI